MVLVTLHPNCSESSYAQSQAALIQQWHIAGRPASGQLSGLVAPSRSSVRLPERPAEVRVCELDSAVKFYVRPQSVLVRSCKLLSSRDVIHHATPGLNVRQNAMNQTLRRP